MSALYCVYALQVAVRSRFDRLVEKEHKGSLYGGTVTLRVDSLLHTRQSRGDSGARRPHPSSLRSSGSLTASLALLAHSLSVGVLQPIPYSLRSVRSSTVGSC